jgi:hypothetical protein
MNFRFWKSLLMWSFRLYGGGGGDGGAGQMRADEQERQRKVQAAVDAINAKFGVGGPGGAPRPTMEQFMPANGGGLMGMIRATAGEVTAPSGYEEALRNWEANAGEAERNKAARESMYTDISGAVRDTAMRDLDRQYGQASKRNTFGLARSGLLGGSADAESGSDLGELYGEGKLKATQAGMGAASDLRSNDEKTRQNLISLAQSGLDTGTASSMAAGQMASAADVARSQVATSTVGRLFDDMTQQYAMQQVMKARYPQGAPQPQTSGYGTSVFSPSRYTGNVQR